jgi:hypothetical protein
MAKIELQVLWTDSDGMLQLAIVASNGQFSGVQETYLYPRDLIDFGSGLERFPANAEDEIVLESGSADPKWRDHLWLRALVLDARGHSAIHAKLEVRGTPPLCARSEFYIPADAATLNRLGSAIVRWAAEPSQPLVFEWFNVEGSF